MSRFRVVISPSPFGDYSIEERVPFFWFFSRWRKGWRCGTESEAIKLLKYLLSKPNAFDKGKVLHEV